MDELIDILDSEGSFTGQTAMKSEAHKKGLFHPTVHVWFYTADGKVLLQQRGKRKNTHPLLWDVSVAGHIGAGEPVETAAIREIEEEIGLSILKEALHKVGVFRSFFNHGKNLIDNEFHHCFLCELKTPSESLKKQESEVKALALIPIQEFREVLHDKESIRKYVPHKSEYYISIIDEIEARLK